MTDPKRPLSYPESRVDRYGDYLYRYAFSSVHDAQAAEDLGSAVSSPGMGSFRPPAQGFVIQKGEKVFIVDRTGEK